MEHLNKLNQSINPDANSTEIKFPKYSTKCVGGP